MAAAAERRLSINEEITPRSQEVECRMRATLMAKGKRMECVESMMTEMTKNVMDLVDMSPWSNPVGHLWKCVDELEKEKMRAN
eukprot:2495717-Karenia_brevis.AAC.1